MAFEQKDLTGSLFRNDRKEKDTHPDFNGSCRIGGHDYWMNAWLKIDKNDKKYFSFAFKLKDGSSARPEPAKQSFTRDLDDEVPF